MGRMCSTWSESGIQFESENGYEVKMDGYFEKDNKSPV